MGERIKPAYAVGYRKPPSNTRFKPGESGNPRGRPNGAKNFGTVMAQELDGRVPVTENGKRKKITKRVAIVKQVVNKATSGDLKATLTVFNETRFHEGAATTGGNLSVFDTPEHQLVMADIVRRIRLMDEEPAHVPAADTGENPSEGLSPEEKEGGS